MIAPAIDCWATDGIEPSPAASSQSWSHTSDSDVAMNGHVLERVNWGRGWPPLPDSDEPRHSSTSTPSRIGSSPPLLQTPELEPNLEQMRHDIVRICTEVMSEIHDLVELFEESTAQWMYCPPAVFAPRIGSARLRYHCCFTCWRPSTTPTSQDFFSENLQVHNGFVMPGELRPGRGWAARSDGRYSSPQTICQLRDGDTPDDAHLRHARANTAPPSGQSWWKRPSWGG